MNSPYTCNPTTGVFERPDREFFAYSDGQEMEAGMLESLRKIRDRSVFSHEVRALRKNWTTKYHFSPLRGNLLRPFADELRGADVLEMGAGCGAVTRFMGEAGARVVAVEGSAMRAAIIAKRCEDLPNVRVIADNFQDFETDQRFDFVTLIGVLEYSRHFIKAEDPVVAALQLARAFLKPGGSLLIAIENQLGLKYFNGAPEDHMGQFAFGLNDSYSRDSVVTFGREELEGLLRNSGWQTVEFYLPFPDYKLPTSVVYPAGARVRGDWDPGSMVSHSVAFEAQPWPVSLFSLEQAWRVISRNGLLSDLANSFLVRARLEPVPAAEGAVRLAAHYSFEKEHEDFREKVFVENEQKQIVIEARTCPLRGAVTAVTKPYASGAIHGDALLKIVNRPGWSMEEVASWTAVWISALREHIVPGASCEVLGTSLSPVLPGHFADAIPTNLAVCVQTGTCRFFDLEIEFPKLLPLDFVIFRGVLVCVQRVQSCARPSPSVPLRAGEITLQILDALGIDTSHERLRIYLQLFNEVQNFAFKLPADAVNPFTQAVITAPLPVRKV